MSAADAERTERLLREQIADLVRARARAEAEAKRLAERARLPGAESTLEDIAARYRAQAGRLAEEVETVRAGLRAQEAELERLRAQERGA